MAFYFAVGARYKLDTKGSTYECPYVDYLSAEEYERRLNTPDQLILGRIINEDDVKEGFTETRAWLNDTKILNQLDRGLELLIQYAPQSIAQFIKELQKSGRILEFLANPH